MNSRIESQLPRNSTTRDMYRLIFSYGASSFGAAGSVVFFTTDHLSSMALIQGSSSGKYLPRWL